MQSRVSVINAEDGVLRSLLLIMSCILLIGNISVLKMLVSLNQYRVAVNIFNNHTFVCTSKCKNLFSVRHSQDFCPTDWALPYNSKKPVFFKLFVMLLTSKYNARCRAKLFGASSFITVAMNVWTAIWLYIILISLSGDVQLNPGLKDKSSSVFSIRHWDLNSITAHSQSFTA